MRKLKKMTELTIEDLSKVQGGNRSIISEMSSIASTSWNTLGCTGRAEDGGYDSCCDDDED